jgi:hypothetical protein
MVTHDELIRVISSLVLELGKQVALIVMFGSMFYQIAFGVLRWVFDRPGVVVCLCCSEALGVANDFTSRPRGWNHSIPVCADCYLINRGWFS